MRRAAAAARSNGRHGLPGACDTASWIRTPALLSSAISRDRLRRPHGRENPSNRYSSSSFRRGPPVGADHGLEAGDDIEEFLVDASLAQSVKGSVKLLQQLVDVPVGPFHRRQAAGIFAR